MNTARGVLFSDLGYGAAFRFSVRGYAGIALKVDILNDQTGAALVLTPGIPGKAVLTAFHPSEFDNQEVAELFNIEIEPSDAEGTVVPGAAHFAEPGDIELHGEIRLLIIEGLGGVRYRVNLSNGEISQSLGQRPSQIHTEWRLVRITDDRRETIYHHQPAPKGEGDKVFIVEASS